MELYEWIQPELLILIPVLYLISLATSRYRKISRNRPLFIELTAILLTGLYFYGTHDFGEVQQILQNTYGAITQGILLAGISLFLLSPSGPNDLWDKTVPPLAGPDGGKRNGTEVPWKTEKRKGRHNWGEWRPIE